MKLIILVYTLHLIVFQDVASAEKISLKWMDNPRQTDSLEITISKQGRYIDLIQLATLLDIDYKIASHKTRVRLDLPVGRMIFTAGVPFVMLDEELLQMPLALLPPGDGFIAPIEPLIELLAEYYAGDLLYDPSQERILASKPGFDILGVRFIIEYGITRAVITSTRSLKVQTKYLDRGGVDLFFPNSTIDTALFSAIEPRGYIESIRAVQSRQGAQIIFTTDSEASFRQLDTTPDPPVYIATFSAEKVDGPDQGVIQRLAQEQDDWALDVVVIDPGHGGKDPGAIGYAKTREKDVALDVGKRLRKELEKRGIKTVMTRDKDVFIPLEERTKIANRNNGKLFISLHCNAARDRRAYGMETYFLAPTKTERAMRVSMRENSVIRYEDSQDQYRDLTEENYILLTMANANFARESQEMAGQMQQIVSAGTKLKDRGVDQAGFYVLIGASMPALLFEMGFISNKAEEKKFKTKKFRQKMAENIAVAVVGFLEESRE